MRKIDRCMNCGEPREIAAYGLCFCCYRRETRNIQKPVNRHRHPAIGREQKKLLRGYYHIFSGMVEIGVSSDHVKQVMNIIKPYLHSISDHLLQPTIVNSEQKTEMEFTVHTDEDQMG